MAFAFAAASFAAMEIVVAQAFAVGRSTTAAAVDFVVELAAFAT